MAIDLKMPVLIVDSTKTVRKITLGLFNQLGLTDIDEAKDADEAIKKINLKPYKLIISNWNLQPVSGLEFLEKIRNSEKAEIKDLPFIMVASENKPANILKAKEAGVTDYMGIPFNTDTLRTKLVRIFG